jgi:CHASE3 domain sensor protein
MGRHAKIPTMDTEEINAIGTLLADLSDRTQQLRGYL